MGSTRSPAAPAAPDRSRAALRRAAGLVRPALLAGWRAAVDRRAQDGTAGAGSRSCLVLAPHPDDETLGCGALIARRRSAGARVRVLVVTDGRLSHVSRRVDPDQLARIRREESVEACAELGVPADDVVHLGLVENTTHEHLDRVVRAVEHEVRSWRPDDVLVTSALDWHQDHRALSAAARLALAGAPGPRLLEYPVWAWADGPWANLPDRPAWRAATDLLREPVVTALAARPVSVSTAGFLDAKRRAMAHYRSQTTNLTGEETWAVMDEAFLAQFMRAAELFFAVDAEGRP